MEGFSISLAPAIPPDIVTLTDDAGSQTSVMVPIGVNRPSMLKVTVGVLPGMAFTVIAMARPIASPAGIGSNHCGLTCRENVASVAIMINSA